MAVTDLPIVPGLTESSAESAPLHVRLMRVMSERAGGSRQKVADALGLLESAQGEESDEKARLRIAAAVGMLRGTNGKFGEEDSGPSMTETRRSLQ